MEKGQRKKNSQPLSTSPSSVKSAELHTTKKFSLSYPVPKLSLEHEPLPLYFDEAVVPRRRFSKPSGSQKRISTSSETNYLHLAHGYEQYNASLRHLRPSVEFTEASSDDLSSEWETSSSTSTEFDVHRLNNEEIKTNFAEVTANTATAADFFNKVKEYVGPQKRDETDKDKKEKLHKNNAVISSKSTSMTFNNWNNRSNGSSGWRKVRSMVQWAPFVQTYKDKKYQWVQLAGHSGNFRAGKNQGTVLKKLCIQEEKCYKLCMNDTLKPYVPGYFGTITIDGCEKYIQLQDCLSAYDCPSIMDCKIGVRTYLEDELAKAMENPKLRKDMYDKMIAVDPKAPTDEEHRLSGVTKPRYMVWRETISSTATLGFRLEGVRKCDGSTSKDFKNTKSKKQILDILQNFVSSSLQTANNYLDRLRCIHQALLTSEFFKTHELIGSSLLFVHDDSKSGIWLIDFGKTISIPDGVHVSHDVPWKIGNHEDGYLIGIKNIILLFQDLVDIISKKELLLETMNMSLNCDEHVM